MFSDFFSKIVPFMR